MPGREDTSPGAGQGRLVLILQVSAGTEQDGPQRTEKAVSKTAAWSCKNAIEREKEMVRVEFGVVGRKPDTGSIENSPLIFKFLLIQ